jgi:protein subunit release factor A
MKSEYTNQFTVAVNPITQEVSITFNQDNLNQTVRIDGNGAQNVETSQEVIEIARLSMTINSAQALLSVLSGSLSKFDGGVPGDG